MSPQDFLYFLASDFRSGLDDRAHLSGKGEEKERLT